MRSVLRWLLPAIAATSVVAARPVPAQDISVTLLGTGTPIPRPDRFGPSILVEAGTQKLLFDCGRAVPIRLAQAHVPIGQLSAVFLTHLHSDHVVGCPDLWLTGWLANPQFAHRTEAMRIVGPHGTRAMMDGLRAAFSDDIRIRVADEKLPLAGIDVRVQEIAADGVVYDSAGVTVTAFTVDHGDSIKPAFGYRIDYHGRSVVLSGDTRPSANVVRYGTGADLLVHEVAMGRGANGDMSAALQRVLAHHTSPEQAGSIFTRTHPRLAVYSHIGLSSYDAGVDPPTVQNLVAATRTTYSGPLEVGADLMRFDIGDSITIRRLPTAAP